MTGNLFATSDGVGVLVFSVMHVGEVGFVAGFRVLVRIVQYVTSTVVP